MRILKYFFFLLLLSLFALMVFIATLSKEFVFEKSKIINSQKPVVYGYINDLQNLKEWNVFFKGGESKISFSKKTSGLGSYCVWISEDKQTKLKTKEEKKEESLTQTLTINNTNFDVFTLLKDTLGKTKVSLTVKGKMDFKTKIFDFFKLKSENKFGDILEKSLLNLSKKLDNEYNFYNIKIDGLVKKRDEFYLSETFSCPKSKISKNSNIVFSKIINFCAKNNIVRLGKPFVIFYKNDTINDRTKLSICIPIKNPIFTTEGSEIICDTLKSFNGLKTILRGNLLHTPKAIKKTLEYIKNKKLPIDSVFSHLELYVVGKSEINSASNWVTEIYIPLQPIYTKKNKRVNTLPKKEVLLQDLGPEKTQDEL